MHPQLEAIVEQCHYVSRTASRQPQSRLHELLMQSKITAAVHPAMPAFCDCTLRDSSIISSKAGYRLSLWTSSLQLYARLTHACLQQTLGLSV